MVDYLNNWMESKRHSRYVKGFFLLAVVLLYYHLNLLIPISDIQGMRATPTRFSAGTAMDDEIGPLKSRTIMLLVNLSPHIALHDGALLTFHSQSASEERFPVSDYLHGAMNAWTLHTNSPDPSYVLAYCMTDNFNMVVLEFQGTLLKRGILLPDLFSTMIVALLSVSVL